MSNNEEIQKANEKLEEISNDEVMQRIADWRESAKRDEASMKMTAMKKGREEGIKQIVRKMKEEKTDIEYIIKVTGLTREEIEKI